MLYSLLTQLIERPLLMVTGGALGPQGAGLAPSNAWVLWMCSARELVGQRIGTFPAPDKFLTKPGDSGGRRLARHWMAVHNARDTYIGSNGSC